MNQKKKHIVIVGGGITGLSAAFYLQRKAEEARLPIQLTLLEQGERLGGKIETLRKDGFIIERGPDSFLSRKTPILTLTNELGLDDQLVTTNPQVKTAFILHKNHLHLIPQGFSMGIPTEIGPLIKTGLLSPLGKLRAGLDLLIPQRKEQSDESVGHFLHRRVGKEVLVKIAEPLLSGIYAGDIYQLSLQATFPQFRQLEHTYRSLIKGMIASKAKASQSSQLPAIAKKSTFLTYKQGLQTLVERLEEVLSPCIQIQKNQRLQQLTHAEGTYQLSLADGSKQVADGVLLTIPPFAAALLLPHIPSAPALQEIPYVSVANVVLAYDQKEINFSFQGTGFVVPKTEQRNITACTWTSTKWPHTAPDGKVLMRCYVGRLGDERFLHASDEEMLQIVQKDLNEIMGIAAQPLFYEVNRLPHSMPQYLVGHTERIAQVRSELSTQMPGLLLTGSGYGGVGIPDCIQQGKEAAAEMITYLKK